MASRFIGDLPKSAVRHDLTQAAAGHRTSRADPGMGSLMARARAGWSHPQERAASSMGRDYGQGRDYGAARTSAPAGPARSPGERYVERDEAPEGGDGGIAVGRRVEHKSFGVGVVQAVDPGEDPIVTVKFSGYAPKRIKARFLTTGR